MINCEYLVLIIDYKFIFSPQTSIYKNYLHNIFYFYQRKPLDSNEIQRFTNILIKLMKAHSVNFSHKTYICLLNYKNVYRGHNIELIVLVYLLGRVNWKYHILYTIQYFATIITT